MTKHAVVINGQELPVRQFKGQRVVTYDEIALIHQVEEVSIRSNFKNNRKHFIENIDYFLLRGKKACENFTHGLGENLTNLNLFTESGYLMLVKSLTAELSWRVQRELVNSYFRNLIPEKRKIKEIIPLMQSRYQRLLFYRLVKGLTQEETGKIMGISKFTINALEKKLRDAGINIPSQSGMRSCLVTSRNVYLINYDAAKEVLNV